MTVVAHVRPVSEARSRMWPVPAVVLTVTFCVGWALGGRLTVNWTLVFRSVVVVPGLGVSTGASSRSPTLMVTVMVSESSSSLAVTVTVWLLATS